MKLLLFAVTLSITAGIANACEHHGNDNLRSVDEDADHHAETSQDRRQLQGRPKPFVMDGIEFPSQEAFVKSGARCGTKDLTEKEREKEENDIAKYLAKNPRGRSSLETIKIDVVFNVIHKSNGTEGMLSQGDIDSQINVLNSAFASSGFAFNLREVGFYENDDWFTGCAGNQDFKDSIRGNSTDGKDVLYIYTCLPSGLLGYAYLPSSIGNGVPLERDGIVLRYSTLPGGSLAPYNEGDTATHEVGHWLGLHHTFSVSKMRR
jgi:hypothetical protein